MKQNVFQKTNELLEQKKSYYHFEKWVTPEMCKPFYKKDVLAAFKTITEKREARKQAPATPLRKQLIRRIEAKLTVKLKADYPYRQSETVWAGGNEFRVWIAGNEVKPLPSKFTVEADKVWNRKGYSGTEVWHRLELSPKDDFAHVGGLLTIFPKRATGAIPCVWYEQGRGFTINQKTGFLIDGYHIEAESPNQAFEIYKKKQARAAKAGLYLSATSVHREYGFCKPGIRNFCELAGIDMTKKYTREQIREMLPDNVKKIFMPYLKKMGIL